MADEAVKVAIRVRPLFPEVNLELSSIQVVPADAQVIVDNKYFSFDYVFDASTTQDELYTQCVAELICKVTLGYNGCVLMYGQTGSGKTHTMGTDYNENKLLLPENEGIIQRAVRYLFDHLTRQQEGHWTAEVSFLEIYNEYVFDLLSTSKDREAICIREGGNFMELKGVVCQVVGSPEEALRCLAQGCRNRSTGATLLNSCSSRSHAIFSIHLRGKVEGAMYTSKLQLVDLAGSEGIKRTHSIGERRKEGVSINLGLLALGNVFNALCSHSGKSQFVPYSYSSLTRLLRGLLNGESFMLMIACISQSMCNIQETISTLRYVDRLRKIKTKPVINKENILHPRHSEIPPPYTSTSHRQATHQTPLRTHLRNKYVCSSVKQRPQVSALQLESTVLAAPDEKGTIISSSDNASFTTAESLSPVCRCPTVPLTPLVERLCKRLEPVLSKDIEKNMASFIAHSYFDYPSTTAVECKVTEQQQTLVNTLDNTLQEHKQRRTMDHTPLQDVHNQVSLVFTEEMQSRSRKSLLGAQMTTDSPISSRTRQRTKVRQERPADGLTLGKKPSALGPMTTLESAQLAHDQTVLELLNSGSERDIQSLATVGPKRARMLYLHRNMRGHFKTFEDLKKVEGLGGESFFKAFMSANILSE